MSHKKPRIYRAGLIYSIGNCTTFYSGDIDDSTPFGDALELFIADMYDSIAYSDGETTDDVLILSFSCTLKDNK